MGPWSQYNSIFAKYMRCSIVIGVRHKLTVESSCWKCCHDWLEALLRRSHWSILKEQKCPLLPPIKSCSSVCGAFSSIPVVYEYDILKWWCILLHCFRYTLIQQSLGTVTLTWAFIWLPEFRLTRIHCYHDYITCHPVLCIWYSYTVQDIKNAQIITAIFDHYYHISY